MFARVMSDWGVVYRGWSSGAAGYSLGPRDTGLTLAGTSSFPCCYQQAFPQQFTGFSLGFSFPSLNIKQYIPSQELWFICTAILHGKLTYSSFNGGKRHNNCLINIHQLKLLQARYISICPAKEQHCSYPENIYLMM